MVGKGYLRESKCLAGVFVLDNVEDVVGWWCL